MQNTDTSPCVTKRIDICIKSYHVHITCLFIDNPGEDGAEGKADGAADLGTFPAMFVATKTGL